MILPVISVPYMVPLFLGMTYDVRYSSPGVDIYEAKYVDNPAIIEYGTSESFYSIVSTMSEVKQALDMDGELSLKIKTGRINVEGKGSYVKSTRDYKNIVEILTTLKYTASVHSFEPDAKPEVDWSKLHEFAVLGTHYVSSIKYGAEMIASARFVVFNSSDVSTVKVAVEGALNSPSGDAAKLLANGTLDQLKESLSNKANLEISYFGTVPLKTIPNTLEGLQTLIENFHDQIVEANLTDGIPMEVYLEPLTSIAPPEDRDQFDYKENEDMKDALEDFEEKFDELRQARVDLVTWTNDLPNELPEKFEQIGALFTNITRVYERFYEVFVHMDMTKDRAQLQPAFDAYDYDGRARYRRFATRVKDLVHELSPEIPRAEVTGRVFTRWGNTFCKSPEERIYNGLVISSSEEGIGGTAKYECVPESGKTGYDLTPNSPLKSNLAEMHYTKFDSASHPFKGVYTRRSHAMGLGVPCAKCYSQDSADIAVFPASASCPLSWNSMYLGYVFGARNKTGYTTEYICLDEKPKISMRAGPDGNRNTVAVATVQSKGSLPSEMFEEGALVRCVVCSTK